MDRLDLRLDYPILAARLWLNHLHSYCLNTNPREYRFELRSQLVQSLIIPAGRRQYPNNGVVDFFLDHLELFNKVMDLFEGKEYFHLAKSRVGLSGRLENDLFERIEH